MFTGGQQAEAPGPRSFFTELLSSLSDLKFSRDGRYMLARDFMTLKLWDVNMESSPVATYPIHEHLKPRVRTFQQSEPGLSLSSSQDSRQDLRPSLVCTITTHSKSTNTSNPGCVPWLPLQCMYSCGR